MITPETFDFSPPTSTLHSSLVNKENITSLVEKQDINHLVNLILPDCSQVSEEFCGILVTDCEFYQINNIPLLELISTEFIKSFVKKGKVSAISVNSKADIDDSFAFTKGNNIKLTLQQDTYQTLGIEGKKSTNKTCKIYVINLNILEDHFVPGKANYDRAQSRLQESNIKFDIILSWKPNDDNICPSSIANYFHNKGYRLILCHPKLHQIHKYDTKIPDLNSNKAHDILEWIGAVSLDCDMTKIDIDATNDFESPTSALIWRGLYSPNHIVTLIESALSYIADKSIPWISINVHSFSNSCVSTHDQHYTIIIDSNQRCFFHSVICK